MIEPASQERERVPEKPLSFKPLVGLQARLLLAGEALNPENISLSPVTTESLHRTKEAVYEPAANASLRERLSENSDYTTWAEKMKLILNDETNAKIISHLTPLSSQLQFDFTAGDKESIRKLYDRYFRDKQTITTITGPNGEKRVYSSSIQKFVDDVLSTYTIAGELDYEELKNDLPSIQWMGNMFGDNSTEIITQLIDAHAALKTDPDRLVQEVNKEETQPDGTKVSRLNNLPIYPHERELLEFLHDGRLTTATTGSTIEAKPLHSDWEKLELGGEDKKNTDAIRRIFTESDVSKKGLPVYYPGSGSDIYYPLAMTDATDFVFVDFVYINAAGEIQDGLSVDTTIKSIGGVITSVTNEGALGHGGKRIVTFNWAGKERKITMYAEDATLFTPDELKDGAALIFVKAPTPFSRTGDERREQPNPLYLPENRQKIFNLLSGGGFINWSPTEAIDPSFVGYAKVFTPPLSDKPFGMWFSIYQKTEEEPLGKQLFDFDDVLATAINTRDGSMTSEISAQTSADYHDDLKKARIVFEQLPAEKQHALLINLREILIPHSFEDKKKRQIASRGADYGLSDDNKLNEYLSQVKDIALSIFPELQIKRPELISLDRPWSEIRESWRTGKSYADFMEETLPFVENGTPHGHIERTPENIAATKAQHTKATVEEALKTLSLEGNPNVRKHPTESLSYQFFENGEVQYTVSDGPGDKVWIRGAKAPPYQSYENTNSRFYIGLDSRGATDTFLELSKELQTAGVLSDIQLCLFRENLLAPSVDNESIVINVTQSQDPERQKIIDKILAAYRKSKQRRPELYKLDPENAAAMLRQHLWKMKLPLDENLSYVEMPDNDSYDAGVDGAILSYRTLGINIRTPWREKISRLREASANPQPWIFRNTDRKAIRENALTDGQELLAIRNFHIPAFIEFKKFKTKATDGGFEIVEAESGIKLTKNQAEESQAEQSNLYELRAKELPIDEQNPRLPEHFFAPIGGNFFNDDDNPTLAGKVIVSVYGSLLARPNPTAKSPERAQHLIDISKESMKDYQSYLNEQALLRQKEGKPLFTNRQTRLQATDGFHVEGKTYLRDFAYYFNKSRLHWKNSNEPQVRAYVTLSPKVSDQIQRHFVDLATLLYDNGIDFTAKAASPASMAERTDNMVFYISASDQAKASGLMTQFLSERGIGGEHVLTAQPSAQNGLSWAHELDTHQEKIWQEVSGSTQGSSFNSFVATMMMPTYLERLAQAHKAKGNTEAAATFEKEAQRVRSIISK